MISDPLYVGDLVCHAHATGRLAKVIQLDSPYDPLPVIRFFGKKIPINMETDLNAYSLTERGFVVKRSNIIRASLGTVMANK